MVHNSPFRFFISLTLVLGSAQPVLAAAPNFSYDVWVTSDYMFRGVSQTRSDPAVQASVSMDTESGWYSCLWASNIDYFESPQPDDGARLEVDLFIGYNWPISERLQADLAWVRYIMPGTDADIDYDYDEWIGTIIIDGRYAVSVAYTANVFGSGVASWHYLASTSIGLPHDVLLQLQVGSVDLRDAYGASYEYGGASLTRAFGRFTTKLDYSHTSRSATRVFDESLIKPRLALTLGMSFD